MSRRILVVSTSRETAPQPTVPIGAAWVAQALQQAGFQARLLDLCFASKPCDILEKEIASFRPHGIGLSVRNLDNCDMQAPRSFLPEVKSFVETIKRCTGARILLGGAGVGIMPREILDYLELEHAVVGEGEIAAPLFFASDPAAFPSIPGLVSATEGRAEVDPCRSSFPVMPRMHEWVDARKYLRLEPVLPVQGKRGCANRCLYCTYPAIEGAAWRIRDAAAVVDEIVCTMRAAGAREFEFIDSVFNEPEGYLETLLEELLRRGVKARFCISSLSPKRLTAQQLRLMERAGVKSLVVTPESADDLMLASLRKGFSEEDVHHAAELLSASKMRVLWCFLLGGPLESRESVRKSAAFIDRRLTRKDAAYLTTGIRIYPGTPLEEAALNEGVMKAGENLLMPKFYFSAAVTLRETMEILQSSVSDQSRCIFVSETQASPLGQLRRLGTMLRLPTPYWGYARHVKRIMRPAGRYGTSDIPRT